MKRYTISTIYALLNIPRPDKRRAAEVGMNPFTFSRVKGRLLKQKAISPITLCSFKSIGIYGLGVYHVIKNPGEEPPDIDILEISRDVPSPLRAIPLLALSNPEHTLYFVLLSSYSAYIWIRKMILSRMREHNIQLYDNLFYMDFARITRFFDFRPIVTERYLGRAEAGKSVEDIFHRKKSLKEIEKRLIETLITHPGVSDDALGRLMNTTRYKASITRAALTQEGHLHETYWVNPLIIDFTAVTYIHFDIDPSITMEELTSLYEELKLPPQVFFMAEDPLRVALLALSRSPKDSRDMARALREYYPKQQIFTTSPSFCIFDLKSPDTSLNFYFGGV